MDSEGLQKRKKVMNKKHRMILLRLAIFVVVMALGSGGFLIAQSLIPRSGTVGASGNMTQQGAYPLPCLTQPEQLPAAKDIHIRVLNGTNKAGWARAITSALALREFSMHPADNYSGDAVETLILYGKNTIASAYELALHFYTPVLILDEREDYLIDVVIGDKFEELVPREEVNAITSDQLIVSPPNCSPLSAVVPQKVYPHELQENTVQGADSGV